MIRKESHLFSDFCDSPKVMIPGPYTEIIGKLVGYFFEQGSHNVKIQINKTYHIHIPENMIAISQAEFQKYLNHPVSILRTEKDFRIKPGDSESSTIYSP
jgi:hypothetical protein